MTFYSFKAPLYLTDRDNNEIRLIAFGTYSQYQFRRHRFNTYASGANKNSPGHDKCPKRSGDGKRFSIPGFLI
jgi:hypothetical protein